MQTDERGVTNKIPTARTRRLSALPQLQAQVPRSLRRSRKSDGYDNWDSARVSFQLLLTCIVCGVVGWLSFPWGLALLIFGGLLAFVAAPAALGAVFEMLRQRHLLRYGHAVLAEVISNTAHNFPDFGGYHTVVYQFVTLDAVEVRGEWKQADEPFWESRSGEEFIMIYNPRRPSSHIAYDAALYRVSSK